MTKPERLQALLVPALTEWASANWPAEPAFAFGLHYGAGWQPIPTPGIITISERDELLVEPDDYGVGLVLWNPGEYEIAGDFDASAELRAARRASLARDSQPSF
jgi:hypothetical protein